MCVCVCVYVCVCVCVCVDVYYMLNGSYLLLLSFLLSSVIIIDLSLLFPTINIHKYDVLLLLVSSIVIYISIIIIIIIN